MSSFLEGTRRETKTVLKEAALTAAGLFAFDHFIGPHVMDPGDSTAMHLAKQTAAGALYAEIYRKKMVLPDRSWTAVALGLQGPKAFVG